jgi:hypothetical protein
MIEIDGIKFEVEVINGVKIVEITSDETIGIDSIYCDKVRMFWGNIGSVFGTVEQVYENVGTVHGNVEMVKRNVDTVEGKVRVVECGCGN